MPSIRTISVFLSTRKGICRFALFCLFLLAASGAQGQSTWAGTISTDWATAGNWSPSGVPTNATLVTIPAAPTGARFPVITTGTAAARDLTIAVGATLTMSGGILQIARDWKNSGTFTATAGTVQFTGNASVPNFATGTNNFFSLTVNNSVDPGFDNNASSKLSVAGDFTNSNTLLGIQNANFTLTFNGAGAQSYTSGSANEIAGAVVINKSAGTLTLASALRVGSFTQTAGGFSTGTNQIFAASGNAAFNGGTTALNASTVTIGGTCSLAGGAITGGICSVTVTGNFTNTSGTLSAPTGTLSLGANFTNNSANALAFSSFTFTGTSTISGSADVTLPAVSVTSGNVTLSRAATCASLTLTNNAAANSFSLGAGITLAVTGAVTINQSTATVVHAFNVNAGTATIGGNLALVVTSNTALRTARVAVTTGTLTVNGNITMTNTFLAANSIIDLSGGAGILNINGTFTVSTLGTLTPGTTSTVVYGGALAQTVLVSATVTYAHLTIDKTGSSATTTAALSVINLSLLQGTFTPGAAVSVAGNFVNNGGTLSGAQPFTFTGAGKSIGGTASTAFGAITIGPSATYNLTSSITGTALTFTAATTVNSSLTHASTGSMTISGSVIVNQPAAAGLTTSWNINAATVTVTGDVTLSGVSTQTRIAKLVITSGVLTVTNIIFGCAASTPANAVVDMSGGAGLINLKGGATLTNGSGTFTPGTTSTVNLNGTLAQTVGVASLITFNNLTFNNAAGVTLATAFTPTTVVGNITVQSGIFSNGGFAIAMATSKSFTVADGATFRLTGTSGMVTGTSIVKTFGPTSTVAYIGNVQTVSAESYGHLQFSGTAGTATKTLPGTAFTVAGDFTSSLGTATSVPFSAAGDIAFGGAVTIGVSTAFSGGSGTLTVVGNWTNNGTFNGNSGTVIMDGANTTISGTGTHTFNNLTFSAVGITSTLAAITLTGNLGSPDGAFTHTVGTITMTGASKTISGVGLALNNLTISGTVTSTASFTVAGNLAVNAAATFTSTAGKLTMSGASKTITNAGTLTIFDLTVTGTVTTASSFSISSLLDVSGTFTASANTITFTGTSVFSGTATLFNLTLNGTSLQLSANATLGISSLFTLTAGTLNANTTTPNTVNFSGAAQTVPSASYYNLTFSGSGTKTPGGALTVNGDLTIGASTTFAAGTFTHTVYGNWTNSGTFTPSTGTIVFAGSTNTTLTGATTFATLTINKTSSAITHTLASNVTAATVNMTTGSILTGSNTLNITTTRTGTGIILGNIQRTHTFLTGVAYEFEGPYNTITFTTPSGITSVTVNVTSGSVADFPFGGSINRTYLVTIPAGTYASAALRLHYEDAELNGNTEAAMQLWKHNGTSWALSGKTSNDATLNYVDQVGLTSITGGRWTCSDDNNVLRWNGSTSTDWATAANWTAVQGNPGTVPSSTIIVQIGTSTFTNQPTISTAATAKSIDFGSAKAVVLTMASGGSLSVQGNVGGTWSANATHAFNVGAQSVSITGNLDLSDGTAGHVINLSIGTGSMTVQGSLTQSGSASLSFSGAGTLSIGTDYTYTSGTFTSSTGTVIYNGTGSQVVAGVSYYHLSINKISGTATIGSATTVGGNLTITAGQLTLNAATTITGNVSIAAAGTLNGGTVTATVGGNWTNAGTFTAASGTITFGGTGAQSIGASTFNNLVINKASGTASLAGTVSILSNLTVTAGTLDLISFTANRSVSGGTFTISNGASLILSGTAFPSNYTTYTLGNTSNVTYNGLGSQTISAISYGNLIVSNGGATAKSFSGTTTVNGNLTISSGSTLSAGSFTVNLYGDWLNSGTFTAGTSTINLRGTTKLVTGTTTFYNLSVFGTYTVSSTDVTVTNTASIPVGGSLSGGSGTITFSGNVTDAGTYTSTGTTTFTGGVSQSLVFSGAALNLATVNFNGTIAPVLSSANAPTFATVTINNTGGVTPSIGWTVTTAFTVSLGATFNGSTLGHTFNGAFTNNGSVTSSGTLTFSPSGAQTIKLAGTAFTSTGTLVFGGTGLLSITGTPTSLKNITIANTTGVTPAVGWTIGGDFTINTGGVFNAGSLSFTVAQNLTSNGTLNGGTSTFTLTGTGAQLAGSTNTTFYDLVISGSIIGADDFNVLRNFTNNGSYSGTGTLVNFTGTINSTISGTASPFNLAGMNVQKQLGVSVILFHNLAGVEQLTITSGTLETGSFTITEATNGTLAIANNATLKLGGTTTLPSFTNYSLASQSTVDYAGTTQAISSVTPYGNLTISATGTKSLAAAVTIVGNFLLSAGTFTPGSAVINLGGNWIMTGGAFTAATSTVYLNGTSGQAISSTGTFNAITVDKPSGDVILASEISVQTLLFLQGKITTGANKVKILSGGTVSGASQNTGWVNGNLQKYVSSPTGAFEVGGSNFYSPVSFTLASVSTPGSLMAKATEGSHPAIAGTNFINYIQRYWTITKPGVDSVVYTTATFTFAWDQSDNYSPIDPVLEEVALYDGSTWAFPTLSGTATTSSNTITGVARVGDFTIGEKCNVATGFSYSGTPYCSSAGTATITLAASASAGTFTSTSGLSLNASTGAVNLAASTPGTYTVTNTKSGNGGCISTSTATITITAQPAATISYATPFCSTNATASVTRTGTAGGTYASTTGLTINSTSGQINIATSTAGTYTVTYTVAAASGCAQFQATTSVTIITAGVWTGTNSTSWSDGGNWSCGSVPTAAISVVIPTGLTRYPVLSTGTGTVNGLTIQSGASLSVTGAILQVAGSISNSGTLTATAGTIELTGSTAQTIPANAFATNTVKSLTINNTAGVTLAGTMNLTDALTITSGALTTGGFLRLKSSATANARVAQITSNAATPVIGNVTVERYIPGRRKYRLITSSVTTSASATLTAGQESLSIWGNWQSAGGSVSNIGTLITGGTSGDGFDQQTTNASLYTYDDVNRRYTQFTSANGKNTKYTPLKAGVAYYMFVYGDRLNTVNAAGPNNTVISATGTLLTGDQLYTTSSANPLSGVTGRYTMLGNPFASPIDWTTIPRTNLANTFWGWDPNLSSTGGYVTVSSSATITLISPFTGSVGLNQYIQPGQGFFVRTTAASPTMTIREQDKVSNFNANAFRVQANSIPLIAVNLMYGSAGSRVMTDGALLAFDPSFRKGIGAEDASKLIGNGESVSLVTEAEVLSIDGRPLPAQDDTVQMHLGRLTRQQYTLQIFGSALDTAHVQPYLEDRYLKTIVPLVLNDTNWIDFEVIAGNAASSDSTRFRLLFKPTASNGVTVNLVATKQNATATLDWQISNESGVQKYKIERSANGTSFTSLTEVTATGATSYRYVDQNPLTGKNYYRVLPVYGNGSSFASGIVLLNMDVVSPVVTVFPNPVRSTNFTLRVTSLPAGRYRLGLFGGDGRAVYSETIEHTAGLFTRFVDLRAKLPAGMYYLRLESESGVYQEKILIQ